MAGDWIKLERATLRKPEVLFAAQQLKISRLTALGLFVEYFCWLDENVSDDDVNVPMSAGQMSRYDRDKCPAVVPHMSRSSLDSTVEMPGFAELLEQLNWASFDEQRNIMLVHSWSKHNGKSAKSRAIEAKKKKLQRSSDPDKNVPIMSRSHRDNIGTREEKRLHIGTGVEGCDVLKTKNKATSASRQQEKVNGKAPADELELLPDWVPIEPWKDWLEMRRAIKKPVTAGAIKQALKTLDVLRAEGVEPTDVLGEATLRCWRGLFRPKHGDLVTAEAPKWWTSEKATLAKAAELELTARGGEQWRDFRNRIWEKISEQNEQRSSRH